MEELIAGGMQGPRGRRMLRDLMQAAPDVAARIFHEQQYTLTTTREQVGGQGGRNGGGLYCPLSHPFVWVHK